MPSFFPGNTVLLHESAKEMKVLWESRNDKANFLPMLKPSEISGCLTHMLLSPKTWRNLHLAGNSVL